MTEEIRAWLQTIAAIGASLAAIIGAIVGYRKVRKKSNEERLIIFSTNNQRTELVVSENGLDLYLYDVRPNKDKGLQWSMTVDELRDILYNGGISVDPDYADDHPEWGLVDIGSNHKDWLYSKSLMGNPKQVHDKIIGLMKKAIEMSKEKV